MLRQTHKNNWYLFLKLLFITEINKSFHKRADVCEKKTFNFNYDFIIIITDPELIANEADAVFDRRERMDVKKPGPFFEASPNNFYLDKLTYRYDDNTNDNNLDAIEGNKDTKNKTKIDENEVDGIGKGQLISKCLFGVIVLTKKQRKFFQDFCPSL